MKKPSNKFLSLAGMQHPRVPSTRSEVWHVDAGGRPSKACDCPKREERGCKRKRSYTCDVPLPADEDPLVLMRKRSEQLQCNWAVYQNYAMDSATAGDLIFIAFGGTDKPTYASDADLPTHAPDGTYGTGWKYLHVGYVHLETGEIREDI